MRPRSVVRHTAAGAARVTGSRRHPLSSSDQLTTPPGGSIGPVPTLVDPRPVGAPNPMRSVPTTRQGLATPGASASSRTGPTSPRGLPGLIRPGPAPGRGRPGLRWTCSTPYEPGAQQGQQVAPEQVGVVRVHHQAQQSCLSHQSVSPCLVLSFELSQLRGEPGRWLGVHQPVAGGTQQDHVVVAVHPRRGPPVTSARPIGLPRGGGGPPGPPPPRDHSRWPGRSAECSTSRTCRELEPPRSPGPGPAAPPHHNPGPPGRRARTTTGGGAGSAPPRADVTSA